MGERARLAKDHAPAGPDAAGLVRPGAIAASREGLKPEGARSDGDRIYRTIAAAIREQRLIPGTKLGEEQLGRIFGVGRPVVRQALMRLAHDHVVEIKPNRGAFIATPTDAQAREVFEARRLVEAALARACALKASRRDVVRLRQHLSVETQAWQKGQREEWIRLTGEFHLLLADIVGNGEMRRFLADLVAKTSLIIALFGAAKSSCPDDHHTELVEAIAAGDADRAEAIMLGHLRECENGLQINAAQAGDDLAAIFSQVHVHPRRGA